MLLGSERLAGVELRSGPSCRSSKVEELSRIRGGELVSRKRFGTETEFAHEALTSTVVEGKVHLLLLADWVTKLVMKS